MAKLTLRLDETLITKAKVYAKQRGTSLSKLFAEFLTSELSTLEQTKQSIYDRWGIEVSDDVVSHLKKIPPMPADYEIERKYK